MVALTVYATLIDVDALGTPVEHVRVLESTSVDAATRGRQLEVGRMLSGRESRR